MTGIRRPTTILGQFIGAISKNIPKDRQIAAVAFVRWFSGLEARTKYAQPGQPLIRSDVYDLPFMKTPEFRWARAVAESSADARMMYTVLEGPKDKG